MSIQNSLLLNRLPTDVLHYSLSYLHLFEQESFGKTCHIAKKVISNLWVRMGFTRKEMKYCLLFSKRIQKSFSPYFDYLTFLPYLLSDKGLTFQNNRGVVKNIQCAFNWNTSAVYFCIRTENVIRMAGIVPTIEDESVISDANYFNRPFCKKANAYALITSEIDSSSGYHMNHVVLEQKECVIPIEYIISDIRKATPLQIDFNSVFHQPTSKYISEDFLLKKFESERKKIRSLWQKNTSIYALKWKVKKISQCSR